VAALTRGLELLESAVGYALASTAMVTPHVLPGPTPCQAWDLAMLLGHVADSAGALREALSYGRIGTGSEPGGADPIQLMRGQLTALLGCMAPAGPADRPVAIGDRELTASMVAVAGAIEIAVHGWDIAAACGRARPVPPRLAVALLAMAPLLVPAVARPRLFADPVPLPGPARAGDELVAFLGRTPLRGDSEGSAWSA
jgi:uncharacterized protein (TIGR03086 family)